MTRKEFEAILKEVRRDLLRKMREDGFWYDDMLRHDPTAWDVNNGACDDFADIVVERVLAEHPGERIDAVDMREFDEDLLHTTAYWKGRFYDAECIGGVKNWKALPVVVNRTLTRGQAIRYGKRC